MSQNPRQQSSRASARRLRTAFEERIDRLIADKGRLASDLVPEEDARLFRRFTRQELAALLAP